MSDSPTSRRDRDVHVAGAASVGVGCLVLIGWAADVDALKSVFPGLVTMKANTALSFVLAGIALLVVRRRRLRLRLLGLGCALAAASVGLLTLVQYTVGLDLGIDQLLFHEALGTVGTASPGRMASATAFIFLLIGTALILLHTGHASLIVQGLMGLALLTALVCVVGYLYGVRDLYEVGPFSSVAVHTATTFLILGLGLLAACRDRGPIRLLTGDGAGATLTRRMIPAAVCIPLLLGWLRLLGQQSGMYGMEFGLAAYAVSNVVVFTALVFWTANHLQRVGEDSKRLEDRFRLAVEAAPNGMLMVGPDGNIDLVNAQIARMFGYEAREMIGLPVDFLVPERFRGEHPLNRKRYFADPRTRSMGTGRELFGRRKDGSEFPVEIGLNPIQTEGRHLVLAAVIDVSERKRTEQALRESEQRFGRFMQHLPGLAWIKDLEGRYVYANDAAERAFGHLRSELYGKVDAEVFPPETAVRFREHDLQALASGTGVQVVETLEHESGRVHHSFVTKFPILGPEGQTILLGGMAIDITGRLEAETALRESEERYRLLMDALPHMAWTMRPDLTMEFLNGRSSEFSGLTLEQVNAQGWGALVHANDLPEMLAVVAGPLERGEAHEVEYRFRRHDGEYRRVLSRAVPMRDAQGALLRWVGCTNDIHDHWLAEEQLRQLNATLEQRVAERTEVVREQEERFRGAFDFAPIGMAMVAPNGRWLRVNHSLCELTGYAEQELLATDFQSLTHPDDLELDLRQAHQVLAGTIKTYQMEKRYFHKAGHIVHILLSVSLVRDAHGEPMYFISQIQDITQRKKAEAETTASLREKEVLLKEIHHRVKNNLQIISSLLDLQSQYSKDEKTMELFRESQNRVRSMALVHERLYQSETLANIDFAEYLENLVAYLSSTYSVYNGAVRFDLDLEAVGVSIEAAVPCGLVVNELVSNCLKYAFPKGTSGVVRLRLARVGEDVLLCVQDNGVGFPDHVEYRTAKTFGLRLVAALVDQLHGTTQFDRDGGTTVQITFPATRRKTVDGRAS